MKAMISNLILTFMTGILVYVVVARDFKFEAVWVSLAATGVVAMFYLVPYWIRKIRKEQK